MQSEIAALLGAREPWCKAGINCLFCTEKQESPTPVAQQRQHKFPIGKREPNEETWIAPQELPRASTVPRMHKTQKTAVNQGNLVELLLTICFED